MLQMQQTVLLSVLNAPRPAKCRQGPQHPRAVVVDSASGEAILRFAEPNKGFANARVEGKQYRQRVVQ